ncbi:hypothetical protein [Erythrobacter donghaensis]|jgi:hypothetical protein|uniref:hypothetical protein n=1 Tax=Erythrobacter donghaensis TaxID=267135 RepID=UPI00093DB93D|nr:hypothetical protein [Erythrobacter donghaensis]
MLGDRVLLGLHGAGVALALTAALVWPRPGQAALLVPLAGTDARGVIAWALHEEAPLLALDTSRGRIIARIADNAGLLRALGHGILPLAARAPGCKAQRRS